MLLETQNFEFGEFLLDAKEKVLLRHGRPVSITPKIFQLLFVLVENHGHIVEKQTLMDTVWDGSFVAESNLTFTMRQLRKALGDDKQHPRFIETIPRRGYRFIAPARPFAGNRFAENSVSPQFVERNSEKIWNSRPIFFSVLAVLVATMLLSAGVFIWRAGQTPTKDFEFGSANSYTFTTVAVSEKPMVAAIAPDGRFVAYSLTANGMQSLWLKQLSTGLSVQIVGPEEGVIYHGVKFSTGSEYIYFSRRLRNGPAHIDRISILGGTPKENILSDVDGAFGISPDDLHISFRRYKSEKRSLLFSDIDGSNEKTIFETTKTITDNVFSPDGKTIAFASGQSDTGERDFGVYTIDLASGEVKPATDFRWYHVRGIAWLPDQTGLLVTAALGGGGPSQLWKVSLQGGEVTKVADSQIGITSISATADISKMLLARLSLSANLHVAPISTPDSLQPLTEASDGLAWMPNGELVYASQSGSNKDIWKLRADKITQVQLTTEDTIDFDPRVSPNGRYIAFVSGRSGKYNVWRMNSDGGDPVALTDGDGEQRPEFTPDGAFVVFSSVKDDSLWKVSVEGGEAMKISAKAAYGISISPDGTRFAHYAKIGGRRKIVVRSFQNDEVVQEFDTPEGLFAGRDIVWIKEGKALLYSADDSNSVSNLWLQPLSGGSPQKFTHYPSEEIFYFDLSPDEAQLGLIRGTWSYEIVLATAEDDPS